MQPISGESIGSEGTLGLGDLILVMGKDEILPPGVDIKGLPQMLLDHGGALNMPAWSACAPGGTPGGFSWFRRLPQSEVYGRALSFIYIYPGAGS